MGNIDLSKVRDSKPMDDSAKHEYSPVVPNGVTSNRYEEMKSSSQIRSTEERELDAKVPPGFKVENRQLLKLDTAPDRFANDKSQLESVRYDLRVNFEKQQKKYPSFYRLLTHILDSLKVIENEKYHLYNTCPDFNIMDSFRSLDSDGKGYIT